MATHSNILSWKIPQAEEPSIYSPWGHKESDMNECMKYTPTCIFPVREERKQHSEEN